MAYDETFRRRVDFSEKEVFGLTHRTAPVRELRPSNFFGPVAEWAERRAENYGDTIVPRYVYDDAVNGRLHKVAWVYHSGVDFDDGLSFEGHHIACDCLYESEITGDPDLMFSCNALFSVLNKRAWFVNDTYSADKVLRQIPTLPEKALFGVGAEALERAFTIATMGYILEHDARHPESWVGNLINNQHQVSLLSLILQKDPEEVRERVELMEEKGRVDFDGETLRLVQEEHDRIHAEKVIRSIADRVQDEFEAA